MQHIQPRNHFHAGEFIAEEQVGDPHSHYGEGLDHAVNDAQTVTREEVVGEAVAGETLSHSEDEEQEPDNPVQLTRLAEGTREEHPEHVQHYGGHKEQRCPVVDLPHEQTASDVEGQVEGGVIRHRHFDALQGQVGALVFHVAH